MASPPVITVPVPVHKEVVQYLLEVIPPPPPGRGPWSESGACD